MFHTFIRIQDRWVWYASFRPSPLWSEFHYRVIAKFGVENVKYRFTFRPAR